MNSDSTIPHWAELLRPRAEVRSSDGSVGELQMSLHKAVYQTVDVPYRRVDYYGDITEPTPNLVAFFARVARRLGTDTNAPALFHLDQGMGGGKSHALVGLYHLAHDPTGFFQTDLGEQVHVEAGHASAAEPDLTGTISITLTADYFTPGTTSPVFGPATNLFERFIWALTAGDMDRYQRYVQAGPNKGTLQTALVDAQRPVLILLDELMDYVMQLSDVSHIDTMPSEKAFLNALMDACDDVPRVAFVVVMIRSEDDERGYPPQAAEFRDYVAARLVRNGQTVAVTEAQDFSAIIRRRLFEPGTDAPPIRDLALRYTAAADGPWRQHVLDKLGARRGINGLEERIAASYPFHPELMRLVREEWSQVSGFQRVRSTVAIFARTALHWVTERDAGRWAPPLIGVGDIPLNVALEQLLSSGLLLGNDRAIQGYRAVANTDVTSTDGLTGRAVTVDEALRRDGVTLHQPAPAVRMATALLCYSLVGRPQGRRGATKAEMMLTLFDPAGSTAPYPAVEEVFNRLTGEEGLGALEVDRPNNAAARWFLSIKQTLRMYYSMALSTVPGPARGELLWKVAQREANRGSFQMLLTVERPGDEPLNRTFEGIDSDQTRLVLLDPRRWTLLNGKDTASRADIEALMGVGPNALRVDNAASCIVACVNTQRRDNAIKRAAEVLAWRAVVSQVTEEGDLAEAQRQLSDAQDRFHRDIRRAFQHYAYLVRVDEHLDVEFRRFDDDSRTALDGGHVWAALIEGGRAAQSGGLGADYLAALLDQFDRPLTPREIVQSFYNNPSFPLVKSTDEIRRALYELSAGEWEIVDNDGNQLTPDGYNQIAINSIAQTVRRRRVVANSGHSAYSDEGIGERPDSRQSTGHSSSVPGTFQQVPTAQTQPDKQYMRYQIKVANKSITAPETRDAAWQFVREFAKVLDSNGDHQLLSIDLVLVTAEGDQGALEARARTLGAQIAVEEDDF